MPKYNQLINKDTLNATRTSTSFSAQKRGTHQRRRTFFVRFCCSKTSSVAIIQQRRNYFLALTACPAAFPAVSPHSPPEQPFHCSTQQRKLCLCLSISYYSPPYGRSVPEDAVKTSLQAWFWHPCQKHLLHRPPIGASSGRGE